MRNSSRPKSRVARIFSGLAYATFLLAALLGGTAAGWVNKTPMSKALFVNQVIGREKPAEVFHEDSITLLLLGCDVDLTTGGARVTKKAARTDMMLVAKLDFANQRITGVSIPRDTECRLPGYRRMKINAYHAIAKSGEEDALTKQAVEHTLPGVTIDRVVTLDYEAFQRVVNLIGGVDVIVPFDMKYTDRAGGLYIDLKSGNRHLDGYKAMGFVRYRKGDRGYRDVTDFERQENQKKLLVAFKDQALKNWANLPSILQESKAVFGSSMTEGEIASLAFFAKDLPKENIQMGQIPVTERRGTTNLRVDDQALPGVLAQFALLPTGAGTVGR
ncbi:MAG: LCP family protein [Fimbriimonas sp.]